MKKTILIVDDFQSALFITEFTLQQLGVSILKAGNAKDALALLDSNKVDLIISDYNMPEMNGIDFIKRVKSMPSYMRTPVFILSTEIKPEVKEKAYQAGVTAWIKKPFQLEQFKQLVSKVLK